MTYRVFLPESVARKIASFPIEVAENIRGRLNQLESDPRPARAKHLSGFDAWRFRVGKYRVLYEIDDGSREITVRDADRRDKVYRGL